MTDISREEKLLRDRINSSLRYNRSSASYEFVKTYCQPYFFHTPIIITFRTEYICKHTGYHHELLKFRVANIETTARDMISAEDVSMKFPRTLTKGERRKIHPGNIEMVKLQLEPKATDPLEAKIAEFDAVIAEADADFYAALHGEDDEKII